MSYDSSASVATLDGDSSSGDAMRRRPKKKRTGLNILAVLGVLVLLAGVAIAGYVFYLGKTFDDQTKGFE